MINSIEVALFVGFLFMLGYLNEVKIVCVTKCVYCLTPPTKR